MMYSRLWVATGALALAVAAGGVTAEPIGDCGPSIGFVFGGGGAVPDGGSTSFGPAEMEGSLCIQEVALSVDLFHSRVGDLVMRLGYDRDCDGSVDTQEVTVICRPGRGCESGSGLGCEARAAGRYEFTGNRSAQWADPCPADIVPTGCYGVLDGTVDFSVFQGEQLGGCFRLYVEDAEADETGFLKQFSVATTEVTCDVPVDDASWGRVKAVFTE